MALSKCIKCGNLYQRVTDSKYCPNCLSEFEKQYSLVKDYLYRNPNSTAYQIAQATGVPVKDILRYIREGRIV